MHVGLILILQVDPMSGYICASGRFYISKKDRCLEVHIKEHSCTVALNLEEEETVLLFSLKLVFSYLLQFCQCNASLCY
jgi:hypothetical protein